MTSKLWCSRLKVLLSSTTWKIWHRPEIFFVQLDVYRDGARPYCSNWLLRKARNIYNWRYAVNHAHIHSAYWRWQLTTVCSFPNLDMSTLISHQLFYLIARNKEICRVDPSIMKRNMCISLRCIDQLSATVMIKWKSLYTMKSVNERNTSPQHSL